MGRYRVPPPPKQLKQEKKLRLAPCRRLDAARLVLLTVGTPSEGGGLSNGGPEPSSHRHIRSAGQAGGAGTQGEEGQQGAALENAAAEMAMPACTPQETSWLCCTSTGRLHVRTDQPAPKQAARRGATRTRGAAGGVWA